MSPGAASSGQAARSDWLPKASTPPRKSRKSCCLKGGSGTNPRVARRKTSNSGVRRPETRLWPRRTLPSIQAVRI